ncbi:hypothetical protein [Curtobacterium flaccumfaciens]|uniref:hypothetical protein n=1 Tax=Curtobacterium flaccumfaciens TaxID=2035 RepID=UPI001BDF36B3|nr:hypothetical protein [Curtobacterium flaccumfaciens]MBT1681907.1 hypothetical protein [Curtobacterium flaccumfaciens pv. flaccumfaciens]
MQHEASIPLVVAGALLTVSATVWVSAGTISAVMVLVGVPLIVGGTALHVGLRDRRPTQLVEASAPMPADELTLEPR